MCQLSEQKEIELLKEALYQTVQDSIGQQQQEVGVAFSGGIDSSLLAKICQDLGKTVVLLTVGFSGSHDVSFSAAIAKKMGIKHKVLEIDKVEFGSKLDYIKRKIGCKNTSHIENCIAYYYIAGLAERNKIRTVLSANGCDELFCGYNGYRMVYESGTDAIMKFMDDKISNEFDLMNEISAVSEEFGIAFCQPFLSREFILFAKTIPIDKKIKGPGDMIRKHILRKVALSIGIPAESAMKPKKALQYGSQIHKHFKKLEKAQ